MSNFFGKSAAMVRKSGMVIVIWLVSLAVAVIGGIYFIEDYQTSVLGYSMWPVKHYYDWIIWIGALTPQVGQVFFAYMGADDSKRWWAWLAVVLLFLVDTGADVIFKHIPEVKWSMAAAIAETVIMYTLCSEIFLALGSGMMLELMPDVIQAIRTIKQRVASSRSGQKWGMLGSERQRDSRHPPPTRSRHPSPSTRRRGPDAPPGPDIFGGRRG